MFLTSAFRWDPQEKWDERRFAEILQKELKGLKIRYNRPDGQKREWRCNKVMAPAREVSLANIMILVIFHLETFSAKIRDRRKQPEEGDQRGGILLITHEVQGKKVTDCS